MLSLRIRGSATVAWGAICLLLLFALGTSCGTATHVRVSVNHPVALWDMPLQISVSGLKPNERAVLRATSRDANGVRYVSSTAMTSNLAGRVKLSGEEAMRVLWSLRPVGLRKGADYAYSSPSDGQTVILSSGGAHTTIHRLTAAPGIHGVPIRHPFYGEYYAPTKTTNPRPGILVFGGAEGGLATTGLAMLYASHGYPTLALAYFGEPGLPRNLVHIPLEYFARALRWLQRQPGVDPTKLAVEGVSRGSEAAQLLGIHYPRLVHAVIALVPANGPGPGEKRDSARRFNQAGWTFRGRPIPWAEGTQYTPFPFEDERIDGPIFLDCAGFDSAWPSCPMAHAIVVRLHHHRFPHRVVLLDYPQAGHGFGALYPNTIYFSEMDGGDHPYSNDEAAASGWPKLLAFLRALSKS